MVLGVLAAAVFLISGDRWDVTGGFTLWGVKVLQLLGLHPETWEYWRTPGHARTLAGSVWTDTTSLTDIGIVLGAMLAASAAGAFGSRCGIPARTALAAVLGGILMGIGARMTGGCNIGAYLGGISVGDVHGWLWGGCALVGTWLGLTLRPLFGLDTPRRSDATC